ncbi:MAG: hypothetical protein KDE32_00865 [Novosphingobium sp.]|nr:hypothetical protein [Novosphingobium sp.]
MSFPKEFVKIASLVLLYPDLESVLISYAELAIDISVDDAARLLYRMRSEADRLNIADAILHQYFKRVGLQGPYAQFLGAIRHCKAIRNQYAHAVWDMRDEYLAFASLDEPARTKEGTTYVPFAPIDLPTLEKQWDFFEYTDKVSRYLLKEAWFREDRRRRHHAILPKALPRPNLNSHRD